ncbi:hypothetical protein EIN_170810 [Entamoeba invadens IP1]|uniref:Potassium channel domain-containing protein n=1 Tax=Entamoeba invadens IP1 TaxID=370355 RepID=A0A0A1TVT6_ENTIV|nr:hypothetical protein EIN_170810 [Entamoeba invadens IP1]ELP84546.1 hypothetical protein EIN_170810 [Entamoeba invadens IP1]|eukprot:XP_004183892.1 hypothetical protein EIN_170810 [Entamoeba invadens IP1]
MSSSTPQQSEQPDKDKKVGVISRMKKAGFDPISNKIMQSMSAIKVTKLTSTLKFHKSPKHTLVKIFHVLQSSYIASFILSIDFILSLSLCVTHVITTYFTDKNVLNNFLFYDFIVNCYFLATTFYQMVLFIFKRQASAFVAMIMCVITFIPICYYQVTEESIFKNWSEHSHIYSLSFVRIIYSNVLLGTIINFLWVGKDQKFYDIVSTAVKALFTIFTLLFFSSNLFHFLEGFDPESAYHEWHNCIYFCVVTVTTVGYGDIAPKSLLGKIYCIFYIIMFFVIFPVYVTKLTSSLFSWKKKKTYKFMKNHFVYTGDVEVLPLLVNYLKTDLVAILPTFTCDPVQKRAYKWHFYEGESSDELDLKNIAVARAKRVMVTSDGDDMLTYLRCELIRSYSKSYIVCYLKNDYMNDLFSRLSVDVINESNMLVLMVGEICTTHYIEAFQSMFSMTNKPHVNILRSMKVPQQSVGKECREIVKAMLLDFSVLVVSIEIDGNMEYFDSMKLVTNDSYMFVLCTLNKYTKLRNQMKDAKEKTKKSKKSQKDKSIDKPKSMKTQMIADNANDENIQTTKDQEDTKVETITKFEGDKHFVIFGYHEGVFLVLEKLRERTKSSLVVVVENLEAIQKDWKRIKQLGNVFVYIGDVLSLTTYTKVKLAKSIGVSVMSFDPKIDSKTIVVTKLIQGFINESREEETYQQNHYIHITCEINDFSNSKFVKRFASPFSKNCIYEMLSNMCYYKKNSHVWNDLIGVTGTYGITKVDVPDELVGAQFSEMFGLLFENGIKCLGVLKSKGNKGVRSLVIKKKMVLEKDDEVFCIVGIKQIEKCNEQIKAISVGSEDGEIERKPTKMHTINTAVCTEKDSIFDKEAQTTKDQIVVKVEDSDDDKSEDSEQMGTKNRLNEKSVSSEEGSCD